VALYGYIAAATSPDIAARYTEAIVSYCESLCSFPHRGSTMRDDVRPGLRSPACASPITRSAPWSGHVSVPHPKKDLGKGLVGAIHKQAGL
jgi:plasmid stabilization system protein ParE